MEIDRKQLQEALTDAFRDIASFKMLLDGMHKNWASFAGGDTTLEQGITEVIARACAESWLVALVAAVESSAARNNPKFRAFLSAHANLDPAQTPPTPDPFISSFLRAYRPFVGRPRLRHCLRTLGGKNESRILMIDGPRGCGKSYSNSFVQFVAEHRLPCRVAYFDLDQQAYTLERFSRRMQEELPLPAPIPTKDQEQDSRWAERLASWVINGTANGQGTVWLLFDGFRTQVHEQGVHDLIDKLAEMVDDQAASRSGHLRLVLINYADHVPEQVAAGAMEERISAPDRREFEECFIRCLTGRGQAEDFARAAFEETFAQARAKAQADPDGEAVSLPRHLNLAMTRALKRLTS